MKRPPEVPKEEWEVTRRKERNQKYLRPRILKTSQRTRDLRRKWEEHRQAGRHYKAKVTCSCGKKISVNNSHNHVKPKHGRKVMKANCPNATTINGKALEAYVFIQKRISRKETKPVNQIEHQIKLNLALQVAKRCRLPYQFYRVYNSKELQEELKDEEYRGDQPEDIDVNDEINSNGNSLRSVESLRPDSSYNEVSPYTSEEEENDDDAMKQVEAEAAEILTMSNASPRKIFSEMKKKENTIEDEQKKMDAKIELLQE